MNAPPPNDPQIAERIASTVELATKVGVVLGGMWAFLAKVAKPYQAWRRQHLETALRAVFAPELAKLNQALEQENGCAQRMEKVLERQEAVFDDLDMVLHVTRDTRDRQDETNELLDGVLGLERRVDEDRRIEIASMLDTLQDRRRARRRAEEA